MSDQRTETDVIIVGAGPIGLEVAVELKRAGVNYLHFDKGTIGATMTWFPNGMTFFSSNDRIAIAGVPIQNVDQSKTGRDAYLAYLRTVAMTFDLDVRTYQEVTDITPRDGGGFDVDVRHARGVSAYRCNSVVMVTGDMHGPRTLGVPGEDLPHVTHYFRDPHLHFGQRVLIVGGKNSAVEAALRCYHAGAHVTMCYRRAAFREGSVKYWLLPELLGRIKRGEISCHYSAVPTRITPTDVTLAPSTPLPQVGERLGEGDGSGNAAPRGEAEMPSNDQTLTPALSLEGRGSFDVEADAVLIMTGYVADMSMFEKLGVELRGEARTPVFDEQTMQTNVPGLYVAGTATAGTQTSYKVFIENCHIHAHRIVAALTGAAPPDAPAPIERPES
ncbi:MAG: SidA/IucD/PvdA family monooxygenase [Phycisphaera sp.]|nr:SidA/IucD/PvdA family monooxygenase [Phycisphaera sp.]